MQLLTKPLREQLLANGRHTVNLGESDFAPVVKLFTPDAAATWLLTELDPDDEDRAFGLCDLGIGFPELGYVSLRELATVRGKLGLPIERDRFFEGKHPISVYLDAAFRLGHLTIDEDHLAEAALRVRQRRTEGASW